MKTIEDYLRQNATRCPDKKAIVCGTESVTYAELWERVARQSQQYQEEGMAQKGYAILQATHDIQFLVSYFAVHEAGCVAVPVEPSTPQQRLTEIDELLSQTQLPPHTADILFTTGTTGKSKGVMISHETILANAENLAEAHSYTPDINFIICGPLNHLGSLSKVYPSIRQGGSITLLEGMKDIDAFFRVLNNEGQYATFMVPASIRMLLQIHKSRLSHYASRISFIETGAAPMTLSEMEELRTVLPATNLFNTYASTEAGIVATYNFNRPDCKVGCVGKAMKNSSFRLSATNHVICEGKTLMTGYAGDSTLTAEVLKEGAIHTSDLGEIDSEGNLFIKGREGDIINVGGYKVAPTDIEEVAIKHESVTDCICIAANHPVIGTVLKLLVVMKDDAPLNKKEMYKFMSTHLEAYKVPFFYEKTDKIARTYNGKLNRKHYT